MRERGDSLDAEHVPERDGRSLKPEASEGDLDANVSKTDGQAAEQYQEQPPNGAELNESNFDWKGAGIENHDMFSEDKMKDDRLPTEQYQEQPPDGAELNESNFDWKGAGIENSRMTSEDES